jgi:hypothetical protein
MNMLKPAQPTNCDPEDGGSMCLRNLGNTILTLYKDSREGLATTAISCECLESEHKVVSYMVTVWILIRFFRKKKN